MRLRYGRSNSRNTIDCDVARRLEIAEFANGVRTALNEGWNGFSGMLVEKQPAKPKGVPPEYVMQPFEVKLTYRNRAWCTVTLEVSYNEVGDADEFDLVPLDDELKTMFANLGFPEPKPVPLMRIPYQIAQKLHGATDEKFIRAQDLVDLQLIMAHETVDLHEVKQICERVFANRKEQPWPSKLEITDEWRMAYDKTKGDLAVLPSCDEAASWVNDLIDKVSQSK